MENNFMHLKVKGHRGNVKGHNTERSKTFYECVFLQKNIQLVTQTCPLLLCNLMTFDLDRMVPFYF